MPQSYKIIWRKMKEKVGIINKNDTFASLEYR